MQAKRGAHESSLTLSNTKGVPGVACTAHALNALLRCAICTSGG